jgi:hypothetical protein
MPPHKEIPEEFKNMNSRNKWNQLFSDWFYCGLKSLELTPKEGVDKDKAIYFIRCIMGSWEPKHEHKEAACAFLLNEYFSNVKYEAKELKI